MYIIKINNKRFQSSEPKITGKDILNKAGLIPEDNYELLYKVNEKGFTPIQLDEEVDLKKVGIEGFKAKMYKSILIKVDNKNIKVEDCFMTPTEIIQEAGLDSDMFYLVEIRRGGVEVSYKDDIEHKVAITNKSCFKTCKLEAKIECVIINAKPKVWTKPKISFDEVVILAYNSITNNHNVIYTVNYIDGVSSKPEGSMLKGDVISVNNKMIFNVIKTDKS